MASQLSFLPWVSAQRQKKFVLVLCVLMWAAIFFISGTLFVRRRYETANQVRLAAIKVSERVHEELIT